MPLQAVWADIHVRDTSYFVVYCLEYLPTPCPVTKKYYATSSGHKFFTFAAFLLVLMSTKRPGVPFATICHKTLAMNPSYVLVQLLLCGIGLCADISIFKLFFALKMFSRILMGISFMSL